MIDNLRLSAHRGAQTVAPENTIAAFSTAINQGFGAIELDPRFTSDGDIFIMHDDTVDRTTDGTGPLSDMTASQVRALEIDTGGYPEYAGQILRVPSFEEAVTVIAAGNVVLNVDGSKVDWSNVTFTDKIVTTLKNHGLYGRSFFVISDSAQRAAFSARYPDAILSWLTTSEASLSSAIAEVKSHQRALLSIPETLATASVIQTLHNTSGVYYQVYNVNTTESLTRIKQLHVPMAETSTLSPANLVD